MTIDDSILSLDEIALSIELEHTDLYWHDLIDNRDYIWKHFVSKRLLEMSS